MPTSPPLHLAPQVLLDRDPPAPPTIRSSHTSGSRPPGYPGLSRVLDSDPDLLVFRRFGELSVRNILYLQDHLSELEEKLKARDRHAANENSDTRRWEEDPTRAAMMVQIRKAMLEYEASLRVHASLLAFGKPSKRQSKNLHNYFMAYNPLVEEENQYIFAVKDLITLSADRSERSSLFTLIESIKPLAKMFTTETERTNGVYEHDKNLRYYSLAAVEHTYRALVVLGSWAFLIAPIVVLYHIEERSKRMIIVVALLVVFSAMLAVFTKAKDWEILGATAAYAAVLVVFFQN